MDGQEKDITLDLPLTLDQASALFVILSMFIDVHEGMEEIPKPENLPDGLTQEEFKEINLQLLNTSTELLTEVRQLVEEQTPIKPESKIILPRQPKF